MLVGCRMEDYLRSPFTECIVETCRETDVTYDRYEVKLRELLFQFEAEVVHRGLSVVEEDKLVNSECRKLAAEL